MSVKLGGRSENFNPTRVKYYKIDNFKWVKMDVGVGNWFSIRLVRTNDNSFAKLFGGCGKYMCMYGGDGDSSPSGICTCTKCEVGTSLCELCMDRGGHSRHKRYLVPEH